MRMLHTMLRVGELTDMATATPEHECRRVRSLSPPPLPPRGRGAS